MSALNTPVQDDLVSLKELRDRLIKELFETDTALGRLPPKKNSTPGMRRDREELAYRKEQILAKMRCVKQKIKEMNRVQFASHDYHAPDAFLGKYFAALQDGFQHAHDYIRWQSLVIRDQWRMIAFLRERANGATVAPAVPDDFEAWRRECYDHHSKENDKENDDVSMA